MTNSTLNWVWIVCGVVLLSSISGCSDDSTETNGVVNADLTLTGSVLDLPVAGISVQVALGGRIFETVTDEQGQYRLGLGAVDQTEMVVVTAMGSAQSGLNHVVLTSLLGDLAHVRDLAGQDKVVSGEELPGAHLSSLTTARHAALTLQNWGVSPNTMLDLARVEQYISGSRTLDDLLRTAVAIHLIATDDQYNLPAGFDTTLALALDVHAVRAFIDGIGNQIPELDPVSTTIASILAADGLTHSLEPHLVPGTYFATCAQQNGFACTGIKRYELDATGRGLVQPRIVDALPPLVGFSRAFEAGTARLTYDEPIETETQVMSPHQIAAFYPDDPVLQDQIVNGLQEYPEVTSGVTGQSFRLVDRGVASALLAVTTTRTYSLSALLAEHGIVAPDVSEVLPARLGAWLDPEQMTFTPFDSQSAQGTWAMPLVIHTNKDDFLEQFEPGAPLMTHAVVTVSPGGTAVALSDFQDGALALSWQVLGNGRLELTYPDGARQEIAVWGLLSTEYGFVSFYYPTPDRLYTDYRRATNVGEAFSLSEEFLLNQPGQFWQTTVNRESAALDEQGHLDPLSIFGLRFSPGSLLDRLYVMANMDNPDVDELFVDDRWNHRIADGAVYVEHRTGSAMQNRCDPADPSCVVTRSRLWRPVVGVGDYIYVLEYEVILAAYADLLDGTWDDKTQQWLDAQGNPVDLFDYASWIPPRLNAYYLYDESWIDLNR